MNNDIKEILEVNGDKYNVNLPKEVKEAFTGIDNELSVCSCELPKILDYITNLQEEVMYLRENDWAWHQTLKLQNAREYRSKFLKDFQKEYGTNTYPDYDEIYKRYDKMKLRIDKAIEYINAGKTFDDIDVGKVVNKIQNNLLNILEGSDKE